MGCVQTKHSIQTPFACAFGNWKPRSGNFKSGKTRRKRDGVDRLRLGGNSQESVRGGKREEEGPSVCIGGKIGNGVREDGFRDGWPVWLLNNVPTEALAGLCPKSADSYHKLAKIGQGAYSIVYKARDRDTGKIVALKRIRFDASKAETVKFVAREILILRKLDHPNVMKLEGIATSRDQYCIYLVFDFMETDLNRVIKRPEERLTEPQVKCYMLQLLTGLRHCHEMGVLHRDLKGCNLLIDKTGMLKIADFGLANLFQPKPKSALTNRVVTLWYRAPELLLGSTNYGVGIDLWSVGCLLAEMLLGRPILPGRTEVEQLHKVFKLCGTPGDDYVKRNKLPRTFKLPRHYDSRLEEVFSDIPRTAFGLLTTLLSLEPADRGTAATALQDKFFSSSPLACDLSGLPVVSTEDNIIQANLLRKRKNNLRRKQSHKSSIQGRGGIALEQTNGVFEQPKEDQEKSVNPDLCRQESRKSVDKGPALVIRTKVVGNPHILLSPSDLNCLGGSSSRVKGHTDADDHSCSYSLLSDREAVSLESDTQSNILRRSISMANFGDLQTSPQTTKLYFSDEE